MLLNPYIAGNPLKDRSTFFGRDDIVREVTQMLTHPDEKAIVLELWEKNNYKLYFGNHFDARRFCLN